MTKNNKHHCVEAHFVWRHLGGPSDSQYVHLASSETGLMLHQSHVYISPALMVKIIMIVAIVHFRTNAAFSVLYVHVVPIL